MAVTQALNLIQVDQSVDNNKSTVRFIWTSSQTGQSHNGFEKVGYYWVSVNGGAETKHTVYSTLPANTVKTIVDTLIEVPHNESGECTVSVRTYMDTAISAGVVELEQTLKLDNIPRASTIISASDVKLGDKCSVKWTPNSASFWYRLRFSLDDWYGDTSPIHPNQTSAYTYTGYTIPLAEVASKIRESTTGTMTVTLYTYSDSQATTQTGSPSSKTFTVTVPPSALPTVAIDSMEPVHSLPSDFNGLYVQGYSKVKVEMSAETQFGASIKYYDFTVEGNTYGENDGYTSSYLSGSGEVSVVGHAVDSRGYGGYANEKINVIPYSQPKVQNVTVQRCDADGNIDDGGNYLKISAKRVYSKVESDGKQKNFCSIRYRYKPQTGAYTDWVTILATDNEADEITTAPLLGGTLAVDTTYLVQVGVVDIIGNETHTTVTIPTDKVYWHRDGARRSFTFGGYVEEDNTFAIAADIAFMAKGGIAAISLYDFNDFNDLIYKTGYYASSTAPSAAGCSNYPVDKPGVLEVISRMVQNNTTGAWWGFAWQTYRTYDGEIYTRSYYSSDGWQPWKMLQMV